jgi:hypothetical protein
MTTATIGLQPPRHLCVTYMKDLVYEHKTDLIRRSFDVATRITDRDALRRITRSVVKRIRMFIQAEGGHLEHLLQPMV